MPKTQCNVNDITGFPLRISQAINDPWQGVQDSQKKLKNITVPTDFVVNWGPPTQAARITVTHTSSDPPINAVFQISGIDTITNSTNLVFGSANYKCSEILSIVQNQHANLNKDKTALYELILAFSILNKNENPSSPDVILLTRPIVFDANMIPVSPFLTAVDTAAASESKSTITPIDMSRLFGYNSSTLMPMVSYQTCLTGRIVNTNTSPVTNTSVTMSMRVNVVMQPLYVNTTQNGLGRCSAVSKYTLITAPRDLLQIFLQNTSSSGKYFLFNNDSNSFPTFPSGRSMTNFLTPLSPSSTFSAFEEVVKKIQIVVPESLLGKSMAEIANSKNIVASSSRKKAFKCYNIDPAKDVVGDQIMVDPTSGQKLLDVMNENSKNDPGRNGTLLKFNYKLYGDRIRTPLDARVIPLSINYNNMTDINAFVVQDGSIVRVAFASLSDISVFQSLYYDQEPGNLYAAIRLNEGNFRLDGENNKFLVINSVRERVNILNDDTGSVHISMIPVNMPLETSGITPGDIEEILVIIVISVVSILLFGYLFFIFYKIMFGDLDEGFPWFHFLIFFVILSLLVVFSVLVEKPLNKS